MSDRGRLIDPMFRARHFPLIRPLDLDGRKARRRLQRLEQLAMNAPGNADVPDEWTQVETVDGLPEADSRHIGRLLHVRGAAGQQDTLNWGLQLTDGSVAFYGINISQPQAGQVTGYALSLTHATTGAAHDVCVDASGNVYVCRLTDVQKLSPAGTLLLTIGSSGSGNGQFSEASTVAIDSAGNIYVVDRVLSRVQKFNSSGVYQAQIGTLGSGTSQFNVPWGICVDRSDNIYVADQRNNRVVKLTSSGAAFTWVTTYGSAGTGSGQFANPADVAVDSAGNIFVFDQLNYRIQKLDSTGAYVTQWGSQGNDYGQLGFGYSLFCDPSDNVYVADASNNRIQIFSNTGAFLAAFGSPGNGVTPNTFSFPVGVTVDQQGNLWVADSSNVLVEKYIPVDLSLGGSQLYVDDFAGGGTTTGAIGEQGWATSGPGNINLQASTLSHPGINRLATGGTSGNQIQINIGPWMIDNISDTLMIALPFSNANTGNVLYRVGLIDNAGTPVDGVYLEYDTSVPDVNWMFVKAVGGVKTRTSTGIAPVATAWNRMRFQRTGSGAGVISCTRQDFARLASLAVSGLSTAAQLNFCAYAKTTNATSKTIDVDYWRQQIDGVTRV